VEQPLPDDFWKHGPLCKAHGGTSSMIECKACRLSLPYRVEVVASIWVPFQVCNKWDVAMRKCDDLPRFSSKEEVKDFIQYNSIELAYRLVQWVEYTDKWAFDEYLLGVGRLPRWKYGPPLPVDEPPVPTKPYPL